MQDGIHGYTAAIFQPYLGVLQKACHKDLVLSAHEMVGEGAQASLITAALGQQGACVQWQPLHIHCCINADEDFVQITIWHRDLAAYLRPTPCLMIRHQDDFARRLLGNAHALVKSSPQTAGADLLARLMQCSSHVLNK